MINVADLLSVHAQAARSKADEASPPLAAEPAQSPLKGSQSTANSKPTLALDNGRYYVVDNKK